MKKLKSRIAILEQRKPPEGEGMDSLQAQKNEKEVNLEKKLTIMKKRYIEVEAKIDEKDAEIEEVSKARDNYREQVLLLK